VSFRAPFTRWARPDGTGGGVDGGEGQVRGCGSAGVIFPIRPLKLIWRRKGQVVTKIRKQAQHLILEANMAISADRFSTTVLMMMLCATCGCALRSATVRSVEPINTCFAVQEYQEVVSTREAWDEFAGALSPSDMIKIFTDPDKTTQLPKGSVAYTYRFDVTRQQKITEESVSVLYGGQYASSLLRSLDTAYVEYSEQVGCEVTILFSKDGDNLGATSDGPTCLWPQAFTKKRKVAVSCPPRETPPPTPCKDRLVMSVVEECPIYKGNGEYSGYDVNPGALVFEESSRCDAATTFGEGARGYYFIVHTSSGLRGYVREECFDVAETAP
jgi:hypothetical protein